MSDNILVPFTFDNVAITGKLIRLSNVAEFCPSFQNPKACSNETLLQMLLTSAVLADEFKDGCHITLQIQDSETNALLITQSEESGLLKAYANDEAQNQEFKNYAKNNSTFTITVNRKGTSYQSLLSLEHESASAALQEYFAKGTGAATQIRIWSKEDDQGLHCGGLFLQTNPEDETSFSDDWQRMQYLLDSVKIEEAIAGEISHLDLLHRLFHEDETRLFPSKKLAFLSGDQRDRMQKALTSIGQEECENMLQNGPIQMHDAYTGTTESFTKEDITALFKETEKTQS